MTEHAARERPYRAGGAVTAACSRLTARGRRTRCAATRAAVSGELFAAVIDRDARIGQRRAEVGTGRRRRNAASAARHALSLDDAAQADSSDAAAFSANQRAALV